MHIYTSFNYGMLQLPASFWKESIHEKCSCPVIIDRNLLLGSLESFGAPSYIKIQSVMSPASL